jgi:hypothetical protein
VRAMPPANIDWLKESLIISTGGVSVYTRCTPCTQCTLCTQCTAFVEFSMSCRPFTLHFSKNSQFLRWDVSKFVTSHRNFFLYLILFVLNSFVLYTTQFYYLSVNVFRFTVHFFTSLVTGDSESIVEILKNSAGKLVSTEPVFLNVYGAQVSIPRNVFRQPM